MWTKENASLPKGISLPAVNDLLRDPEKMEANKSFDRPFHSHKPIHKQGCQIFLGTTYQNGKKYQLINNVYKWPQNIPNGSKIYQMAIKYTNICHSKTLQNLPK
jgi:hypothetical protein